MIAMPVPMLAAWIDYLQIGIVVVIMAGSGLGYIWKEIKKADTAIRARKETQRRQQQGDFSGGMTTSEGNDRGQGELDRMAAQRRAELRAQTKQRGGTPAGRPDNLSMRQMRERMQAKVAYDQRAAALRAQSSSAPVSGQSSTPMAASLPTGQQSRQATAARKAAALNQRRLQLEARQRAARQKAQQLQEQTRRAEEAQRAERARTSQRIGQPATHQLGTAGLSSGATTIVSGHDYDSDTGESYVHRHVSDAGTTSVRHAAAAAVVLDNVRIPLTGPNLRHALVLNEILSPPVALREMA